MELVFGVIGAVIGLGGLVLTYAGLGHQRRQARELDAREQRLLVRELEMERREATLHASMLRVEVGKQPSALDAAAALWRLTVTNDSTQPFTGVSLRYGDQALTLPVLNGLLGPGASVTDTLPVNGEEPDPSLCTVEFTDVAGRLWRRLAVGELHRGRRQEDGEVTWDLHHALYVRATRLGVASAGSWAIAARRKSPSKGVRVRTVAVVCVMAVALFIACFVTVR